jgi:hypothetical protein
VVTCEAAATAGGAPTFRVVRVDGRGHDNARPLVAVSARDAGGALVVRDAAEVPLDPVYANGPACGATCAQGAVTFGVASPPDD